MRRSNATRMRLAAAATALALGGCGNSLSVEDGPLGDLTRARAAWQASRPQAYEYVVERHCFCPVEWRGPVRVTVVGDDVTALAYVASGDPVPSEARDAFPSVDGLFEIVRDAIDGGAHSVHATYHADSGVPLEIRIDYIELAVDEELGFDVVEQPTVGPPAS